MTQADLQQALIALAIAAAGCVFVVVMAATDPNTMPGVSKAEIALHSSWMLGVAWLVFAAIVYGSWFTVVRVYTAGIVRTTLLGTTSLHDRDVERMSYSAVDKYTQNGIYRYTTYSLMLKPFAVARGKPISFTLTCDLPGDRRMEVLRDRIAARIAANMIETLQVAGEVEWIKGITIKSAGVESRQVGVTRFISWPVLGVQSDSVWMYLFDINHSVALMRLNTVSLNFFPGWQVVAEKIRQQQPAQPGPPPTGGDKFSLN
ncbi:hypothetical protein [Anatilimnocola aggregata]|nr:hypothetical protein [Anatilimnocola aggregata]